MHQIDWKSWKPNDQAVIVFLRRKNEILLIHKKRGLGAGKVNGPGGKCEAGESPLEAAIRETEEEIGLRPKGLEERGVLSFQFLDGYALEVHLFLGWSFSGELVETDEADPFWIELDDIPFDRMWADDELWLPHIVDGERVAGRFLFDGDTMEDYAISYLR